MVPAGGSSKGKCEVDKELDCGWQLIIDRLKELGQLDRYEEKHPGQRLDDLKGWRTTKRE